MLLPALTLAAALAACLATAAATEMPDELVVSGLRPARAAEIDTSLSLLDAQTIRAATLSHAEELVQFVPNMNFSGEGSRARYIQLRGIGELEQYEGAPNPSVGYILDDIDLSGIGGVASTWDIARVEVLRGPQSARYGSSALAGLVYMQSRLPGDSMNAAAEITAGSDDTGAVGLALGGPLSDTMSARISGYRYRDNGYRDNAWLGRDDTNQRDELTLRSRLVWQLTESWDAVFTGLYADFDNGYDAFALDNGSTTFSDEPGRDAQRTRAASLRLSGPVSQRFDLVAISSVADSDIRFSYDGDWVNEEFWLPIVTDYRYSNPRERDTLTQELRLVSRPDGRLFNGSTDWVTGLYWNQLRERNRISSSGEYIEIEVGCEPGICITDRSIDSQYEARTLALFAGTESRLADRWRLTLGLRGEHRDAAYDDSWVDNGVFIDGEPVSASNRFRPDDTLWGGHASLAYDFTAAVHGYARIARGFKAGGFNPSLAALGALAGAAGQELVSYKPEYLWNYEAGVRGLWLDGGLTADLSVFYMDRRSAQLSQSEQLDPFDPNTFVFITANGAAEVRGVEATVHWEPAANWAIDVALGLLDTEITEWPLRPEAEGRELAHAPSFDANVALSWQSPQGWHARLDLNAVAAWYFDVSHDGRSSAYRTVNLRFGHDWERWGVSLWARNLLDRDYATRGFFFGNEPPAFEPQLYTRFGTPRQLGVSIQYRYE